MSSVIAVSVSSFPLFYSFPSVHPPSTGRFVTRRRRAVSTKSKFPKATVSVLDSSDDFTSAGGALCGSRVLQPSKRRRVPPPCLLSSVEKSVNAARTGSFATNTFREISLNESADHSLGPGSRKPIFCSTPSATSFSKRPHVKPFPINDQSSPPSMLVSCIGLLSTFQEDLDSPGQQHTTPPPVQVKDRNKTSSCSEVAKSYGEDSNTKNSRTLPSLNPLFTDSESSSRFVSAAAGLEWLIEVLKEQCLRWPCTVELERFDKLFMTQLCSETTYSSCLGHSRSDHIQPTNEHLRSVDSGHTVDPLSSSKPQFCLHSSVNNSSTHTHSQVGNSFESSVTNSQITNLSQSVDYKQSSELSSVVESSMEQSASVLQHESTHCSSVDLVMDTESSADSPVKTLSTAEEAVAVKSTCLTKKCIVQLKAMALSQQTVQQPKGFRKAGLACKSVNLDANESENNCTHNTEGTEELERSGGVAERMMTNNSAVTQTQSNELETLRMTLKEKCLTNKLIVETNNLNLSQLKENLQFKSPTAVSDSASYETTKSDHQSESDTNHCKGGAASVNVSMKTDSTTSGNDMSSDKDVKNASAVLPKRRKTSAAPKEKKRRSTSTDRPGTTRKAGVSGLSVNRWKNKNGASAHMFKSRTAQRGGNAAVDCSISELISTQHKQGQVRTAST